MPNILKRPMFKNGSSAQGTGVTSGLDRQKALIDYVSQLKRQAQPTTRERIGDFLTAFGASKGLDLGASLQDTGKNFAALSAKRQDRADKYAAALDSQLLKMFGDDKQQLNSFLKTLRARAQNAVNTGQYKDFDTAYKALFMPTYNDMYKREKAPTSIPELVRERDNQIKKTEIFPPDFNTRPIAETQILIEQGKIKDVPSYSGVMRIDDVIIEGDGTVATPNTKKSGYPSNFIRRYKPNQFYIANDGSVYQYQGSKGKGTFKRVYP